MERKIKREREREREKDRAHKRVGGRDMGGGHACKIMLTNSESQVSHHVLFIYGTYSKMHKR